MKACVFALDWEAYRARREVAAAATLRRMLERAGMEVRAAGAFPQNEQMLLAVLEKLCDDESVQLILTTGANGCGEDDCAPEAVTAAADRMLPGIAEAVRAYNVRYSKKYILDRSVAGIRKKTLMINLPESPKLAQEDMEYILPELIPLLRELAQ